MKTKYLNVLGVMTGTSLDGMDLSIIKTDGKNVSKFGNNYFFPYPNSLIKKLKQISELRNKLDITIDNVVFLENEITAEFIKNIKKIIKQKFIDVVGIHGQTIYHEPCLKKSLQLCNGQLLANAINKTVVNNFRYNDILNGGQGAPIAPIFHKFLIEHMKISLPSCFINIGGISNITYYDYDNLIGFDTGPGNCLSDDFTQLILNKKFDNFGILASRGKINKEIVNLFLKNPFFFKCPPKSLDRQDFKEDFFEALKYEESNENFLASICEVTALSISKALNFLPNYPKNIIFSGGGVQNTFITSRLKNHIKCNFIDLNEFGLNEDFIEAQLIGFLTVRAINKLPITFPKTTGVKKPLTGGKIYTPKENH